jgi:hypothetical protein
VSRSSPSSGVSGLGGSGLSFLAGAAATVTRARESMMFGVGSGVSLAWSASALDPDAVAEGLVTGVKGNVPLVLLVSEDDLLRSKGSSC